LVSYNLCNYQTGQFRVSALRGRKGNNNMMCTYQRLKRQRQAGEIDGFTLIELLIVIVVLGILAAVVIFALGGITGKSALASCQADGATVSTALAAFNAQNPTVLTNVAGGGTTTPTPPTTYDSTAADYKVYSPVVTSGTVTSWSSTQSNTVGSVAVETVPAGNTAIEALLSSTSPTYQGPYIQSWPNNSSHYGFELEWTQTSVGAAGAPATWSANLYVVTGDTYVAGTASPVVAASYSSSSSLSDNGNLTQAVINAAVPNGSGALNSATPQVAVEALYSYAGPTACAGVS
jgi:prepilin-type N-terminal cleavage/methylation domain-containing protein